MKQQQLDEVLACLSAGKTRFYYHRDRYVLYLLQRLQHSSGLRTIRDVKKSRYHHWLNKPFIKQWLAQQGRDDVLLEELLHYWPVDIPVNSYTLSFGRWGQEVWNPWFQTSRAGENLVVQLNLPFEHQRFLRQVGVSDVSTLQRSQHPHDQRRITLAWARVDFDWQAGQAMIEEIQSDWTRDVPSLMQDARDVLKQGGSHLWWWGEEWNARDFLSYQSLLTPYQAFWSEAVLTAVLQVVQQELGLREVFYHEWQTGNAIKRLPDDSRPPQSLYKELPKQFGFEPVATGPVFLERDPKVKKVKKRQEHWRWYRWAA